MSASEGTQIYRFIPDALGFRRLAFVPGLRWWPEGLDVGPDTVRAYPVAAQGSRSPYQGNRYPLESDRDLPVSDFPALQLDVLVMSERAHAALRHLRGLDRVIPITVGEERFVVPQLPALAGALDLRRSEGLRSDEGELLFIKRHVFDEAQVQADAFWIAGTQPHSNVYLTGAFRDAARAAGLTGLDQLELVADAGAPVETRYVVPAEKKLLVGPRHDLEDTLVAARAHRLGYPESEARQLIERAFMDGTIPFTYMRRK